MLIQIKCAWCGLLLGVKQGEATLGFTISHSICSECTNKVTQGHPVSRPMWDGVEKRRGVDRRRQERRQSDRYVEGTLIVLNGVTWIDSHGIDRRRIVRREADKEMLMQIIFKGIFGKPL
jgi:hypothetical protein